MRWSEENEAAVLHEMDVGLMPLPDTDRARGKCACKMLQYMATGLPVVVAPVGVNQEILTLAEVGIGARSGDDWYGAIAALHQDPALRQRLGSAGRGLVETRFDRDLIAREMAEIFQELGG